MKPDPMNPSTPDQEWARAVLLDSLAAPAYNPNGPLRFAVLMQEAHRFMYHSTLDLRVMKKNKKYEFRISRYTNI